MADMTLPSVALSIRQPWATALAKGWKDIENRSWHNFMAARRFRGPFAIHASRGMTQAEYEDGREFIERLGFPCPAAHELPRGGIIGAAVITDAVRKSSSPWFFGPLGLVVAQARECTFVPASGLLGFFQWSPAPDLVTPVPRWMQPAHINRPIADRAGDQLGLPEVTDAPA